MEFLAGLFGGPIAWVLKLFGGSLGKTVMDFFATASNNAAATHKADVEGDTTVAVAAANAQVEVAKLVAAQALADKGMWMKKTAFFTFFVLDIIPRVLDNTFHLNWHIQALAPELADLEVKIILLCVGYVAFNSAIKPIFTKK